MRFYGSLAPLEYTVSPSVTLRKGKDEPVKRRHPWIFSGAIDKKSPDIKDGDLVTIYSSNQDPLGVGFYTSSSIAVKVLSFGKGAAKRPVEEIIAWHLHEAALLRNTLGLLDHPLTTAYRLANAEGDQLPGLIIDIYNDIAVMQTHSPGMYRLRAAIAKILLELKDIKIKHVLCCDESSENGKKEWISEPGPEKTIISENGHRFHIDLINGQKTGFFLDQRMNRSLIGSLVKDRSVLNVCSYTGGFSIYALKGGACQVTSLDVSKDALALAHENAVLNGLGDRHSIVIADCFEYLTDTPPNFDCIVLDPPAFAKHRGAVKNALKGYRTLNRLGFQALSKGGLLATFSCSQLVSSQEFESAVLSGAIDCGKTVRVLYHLHQAPCHPTSIHHPEGPYLKGLILEVR